MPRLCTENVVAKGLPGANPIKVSGYSGNRCANVCAAQRTTGQEPAGGDEELSPSRYEPRGRRFKSCQPDRVMSQDIGDTRTCECRSGCRSFPGSVGGSVGCWGVGSGRLTGQSPAPGGKCGAWERPGSSPAPHFLLGSPRQADPRIVGRGLAPRPAHRAGRVPAEVLLDALARLRDPFDAAAEPDAAGCALRRAGSVPACRWASAVRVSRRGGRPARRRCSCRRRPGGRR